MVKMDDYVKLLNEQKAVHIATYEREVEDINERMGLTNDVLAAESFADLEEIAMSYSTTLYLAILEKSKLEL